MCVLQHLRWRICESGKDVCKSMEFQDSGKNQLKSMEFQDPVRVPKNETFNLRNSKARNTKNRSKTAALCWCAGLLYRLHNFWALGWRGKNPENTTHPGGTWGFGKKQLKSREFLDPVRVPKNVKLNLRKCKARNTKKHSKTAALCWCACLLYR